MVSNNLKGKSVKGTLWSMIERFSTMGIQLLCTLAIAQFLTPAEFGLVSMMSIFLAFSTILIDSGFGQAIIREQNVTELDYSSLFYFNIFIGAIIYAVAFFCAPLIAHFYNEPQLIELVRISFISLFFLAFSVVQQAQLYKSVNFSKVSKISLISVIISGIAGIIVAYIYKNVWALIVQTLTYSFLRTSLLWIFSQWHPKLIFSQKSVKKYLKFSLNLLGSNLIAAIADNLANLFIGKNYSADVLGNYTIPDKLQRSIAGTISFSIHRVSYPIMATFQNDDEQLRTYSQKVVGMAFYIIAPIMTILFVVSEDLFSIILSPEWIEAAHYFKYMCIIGAIYCFADINMDIMLIKGRTDWTLRIEIVRKTMLVIALVIGIMFNIETLLKLLVAYNVFNAIFVSFFSGKLISCSIIQQLKNLANTILILFLTVSITYLITNSEIVNILIRLSTTVLIGITSYIILSIIFHNQYFSFIIYQVKSVLNK